MLFGCGLGICVGVRGRVWVIDYWVKIAGEI